MNNSSAQAAPVARRSASPLSSAAVRLLLTALAFYSAALMALLLRRNSRLVWNDMRGAPTLAIFHGTPIYQIGIKKVAFPVLYGPFSYLFHLPAAFFHSPQTFFLAGSVISLVIYCAPIIVFAVHAHRSPSGGFWMALLLALTFMLFTMNNEALTFSSMAFSPDAAAIGFAGLACAILFFHDGARPWLDPALIAIFTCCAIGSKQNTAVLAIVLLAFGLLLRGWTFIIRLALSLCAALLTGLAVIWAVYRDLYAVYFNNVVVPAHYLMHWSRAPFAAQYLYANSAFLLFVLGTLALLLIGRSPRAQFFNREQFSRVAIFAATTVCVTPSSIIGVVFAGGAQNALSPSFYFCLLTLLAFSYMLLLEPPPDWSHRNLALSILLLFVAVQAPLLSKHYYPQTILRKDLQMSSSEIVYSYALRHPGEVYFPFNQVTVFYAEHAFYHADWGVANLRQGGVRVPAEDIRRHIPSTARYVAYPPDVEGDWLAPYIAPHYKSVQLAGLPRFSVFEVER